MKTTKLTPAGKLVIFVLVIAVVLGGAYFAGGFEALSNLGKNDSKVVVGNATVSTEKTTSTTPTANPVKDDILEVSLDEWVGWKPIIDANDGIDTKAGSIYNSLGLKVHINIINDATQSSNALINGNLDAAGYTINRFAFLYPKFKENNVPVKMVYITNYSNGGDGIIASSSVNGIEGLVGKSIAVPRFSEAQTLVEWLISKSTLSAADTSKINKVMFNTPDDAAKAFFAGQVDAAATWQPYLSQAASGGNKVLFSTKSATNIILDGIVFRQDYIAANPDKVQKFIKGALLAESLYTTKFTAIKDTMPLFATESDENIKGMTGDAALANCSENTKLFGGIAQTLYTDMCNIWTSLGEKAEPAAVASVFDNSFTATLLAEFPATQVQAAKFTQADRDKAKIQDNTDALLKQTFSIQFKVNSDEFTDKEKAYAELAKFIDTAKILNNTIVQIEGNTDSVGNAAANQKLSEKRALAVATYLKYQGLDPTRFVVIGNGPNKPVADNTTDEGKAANRRTDIFFKVIN